MKMPRFARFGALTVALSLTASTVAAQNGNVDVMQRRTPQMANDALTINLTPNGAWTHLAITGRSGGRPATNESLSESWTQKIHDCDGMIKVT
jgi:hypothetical protein